MIYGYAIIDTKTETHGLPFYCSDQWSDYPVIRKVRLFSSKKERDNAMNIEKKKHTSYLDTSEVAPFKTSSVQGKLSIIPTKEIKKEPQI